jgi:hypothetical protein
VEECIQKFWPENLKEREKWESLVVDGNRVGSCGLDASGSGQGPVAGSGEHGKEPSGSLKGGEFLA